MGEPLGEHIKNLDIPKALTPDGTHLRLLREPDNVTVRPLSNLFQRLWQSGGVSEDWKKANNTSVFKKGHKVHEELEAGQLPLDPQDENATCHPGNRFQTHEGQEGN